MKVTFTERKVSVSDELKQYAQKKCEKLDRFFDRDSAAKITFSTERGRHIAEITVQHAGMLFRASEQTHDMYASVDGAVESIERQIQKNKTRLEKKLRQGAFEKADAQAKSQEDLSEDLFDVIRTKEFEVKPMMVEEAILQMNLLDHHFFFFRNHEENDRYSVVYKRNNGGYGLIISK
ncbi:ribosome hibernation-promoting factor, HPF/YfiA family [Acidaminobacterium chupaoyuni]